MSGSEGEEEEGNVSGSMRGSMKKGNGCQDAWMSVRRGEL